MKVNALADFYAPFLRRKQLKFERAVTHFKKHVIIKAFENKQSQLEVALFLNVPRSSLQLMLIRYGILEQCNEIAERNRNLTLSQT